MEQLYQRGAHSPLLVATAPRGRLMLSVVLSVGGGMIRHFTSFDVGR
jgi:hypothetical protein